MAAETANLNVANGKMNAVSGSLDDFLDLLSRLQTDEEPKSEVHVVIVRNKTFSEALDRGLIDHERRKADAPK